MRLKRFLAIFGLLSFGWSTVALGMDPSVAPLASAADMHGKRIAVAMGSAQEAYANRVYADSTILQYQSVPDTVTAVISGKADGAISDEATLAQLLERNDTITPLGDSLFTGALCAGFRLDNVALRTEFDRFLKEIKSNGVHQDMVDRWIKRRETTMPKIPTTGANGELLVGAAVLGFPLAAVKDNELSGFEFEIIERFAAFLGKKTKYQLTDISGIIASVASGKSDLAAGLYDTAERRKRLAFSQPYYDMGNRFFVLKARASATPGRDSSGRPLIAGPGDLHGRRIAVLMGSAFESYAAKTFTDSSLLQYQSASDMVLAVKTGAADVAVADAAGLRQILLQNDTLGTIGEPVLSFPVGIGFRKDSPELRAHFNDFLQQIRSNGVLQAMNERWLGEQHGTMPTIDEPANGRDLLVGTTSGNYPFEGIENNELVGFDIELARRFAAFMGQRAKFAMMDFGALIPALVTGKIDLVAASVYITPERQKSIDFSDPYNKQDSLLFALKSNIAGMPHASGPSGEAIKQTSFVERLVDSFKSNILTEKRYLLILDGLGTTMIISVFSALFGTVLGGLICFMRMSPSVLLTVPAKAFIGVLRGTPVLVLLMLIFYVVFASVRISPTVVAVIAFGLNFAAYFAEIFRAGMSGLDPGQREAGIAMGFTPIQTFFHVILPQTIVRILPVYKGEFISLVKMTSVVGYIAVQDLTKAGDIIRSRTFDAFFPLVMVAVLYFLIAWVLLQGLEYLERRTDPMARRLRGR